MNLDQRIDRALWSWRLTSLTTGIVGPIFSYVDNGLSAALISVGFVVGLYYFGLWAMGKYFAATSSPEEVFAASQGHRIRRINERLDAGELEADTEELEKELIAAGLKPLAVVVERGPILGRQFDVEFYDYVMAREGLNGEVLRYEYIGQAQFDEDGTITNVPNFENLYVPIDGNLYEHILEVVAEPVDAE